MSEFLDEVSDDCLEAETDLGEKTMVWNGDEYPVAPSLVARNTTLVVGGREVEIRITLRVRVSGKWDGGTWAFQPQSMPKHGQRVTYGGIDYRIAAVDNGHETILQIHLMDVNR